MVSDFLFFGALSSNFSGCRDLKSLPSCPSSPHVSRGRIMFQNGRFISQRATFHHTFVAFFTPLSIALSSPFLLRLFSFVFFEAISFSAANCPCFFGLLRHNSCPQSALIFDSPISTVSFTLWSLMVHLGLLDVLLFFEYPYIVPFRARHPFPPPGFFLRATFHQKP